MSPEPGINKAVPYFLRNLFTQSTLFLSVLTLVACDRPERVTSATSKGDIGKYLLQQVQRYGSHPKKTNDLPQISTTWKSEALTGGEYLEKGEEQLTIYLPDNQFESVQTFVLQAFGPSSPGWSNAVVYEKHQMGVALSVDHNGKTTRIIMNGNPKK